MRKQVLAVTIGVLLVLSVFSVLQLWQIKPVQAIANTFASGFEKGGLTEWTTPSSASIVTTPVFAGTNACRLNENGASMRQTLATSSLRYYSTNVQWAGDIVTGETLYLMGAYDPTSEALFQAGVKNDSGTLKWQCSYWAGDTWQNDIYTTPTPAKNTWFRFMCEYVTGGKGAWWINDDKLGDMAVAASRSCSDFKLMAYITGGTYGYVYYDSIRISDTYIGTGDPTYYEPIISSTYIAGSPANLSAFWLDDVQVSGGYVSTNTTGPFTNSTWTAISAETGWTNATITLNSTAGNVVSARFCANNSAGTLKDSILYNMTTIETPAPTFDLIFTTNHTAGGSANLCIRWNDTLSTLSYSIIEHNNTGVKANSTAYALSGNSAWHNFTITLNGTAGNSVVFRGFGNNSANKWTISDNYTFIIFGNTMALHVEGEYLIDDTGRVVVLKGFNKHGFEDGTSGSWLVVNGTSTTSWDAATVAANLDAMKLWGANQVRYHQALEWTAYGNDSYWSHIQDLADLMIARGMYMEFDYYQVQAYGETHDNIRPYYPYPPFTNDTGVVASSDVFAQLFLNATKELMLRSNIIMNPYNEVGPDYDPTNLATWATVVRNCTNLVRNISDCIITLEQGYGVWCNDPPSGGHTMEWILDNGYNVTNILYQTHLYGQYNNPFNLSNYAALKAQYQYCKIDWVGDTCNKPLYIGEVGQYITAADSVYFNNTLTIMDEWNIGYSIFWFWNGGVYRVLEAGVSISKPQNWTGFTTISHFHSTPFVFSAGKDTLSGESDYYIYGNSTSWSSTWLSNQLTVTYSGVTQVRVFWNVSASYPMNSSLYCYNSNGTNVLASDVYDATTNLIRLNSTSGSIWIIGYSYPSFPPAEEIIVVNTWWYGYW